MKRTVLISGLFLALSSHVMHALEKQDILWHLLAKRSVQTGKTFTKDTIEKSTKPLIIAAFATWCPYCKRMQPILEQLEKELGQKYTFVEFDFDQSPELVVQFNIKSLPTFIFINNKREVGRELGSKSQENFKKLIVKYLG